VHHFDPLDKDALFIWDTMEGAKLLDKIFGVVTISSAASPSLRCAWAASA
jgi:putative ABC transport system permease protein